MLAHSYIMRECSTWSVLYNYDSIKHDITIIYKTSYLFQGQILTP